MKRVALIGVTGAVGQELLALLQERSFPISQLRLFASERSAGRQIAWGGGQLTVEPLPADGDLGVDIAFSAAGGSISRQYAWDWAASGATVIDNTSAWRLDERVPLVSPEVNAAAVHDAAGIIAVPNCSTIIALMALAPLHRAFGLVRATVATYQAVSGAGAAGITELTEQSSAYLAGEPLVSSMFQHPIAFNLFSHDSEIGADGYNEEEAKLLLESRKILGLPDLRVSATCIRVPVFRAHSEAIHAEFERSVTPDEAREVLAAAPGVTIQEDRAANTLPMRLQARGVDDVLVGRLRSDSSLPGGLALFVSGDQIRKGAALNAVQIAELLLD
jgi:aspartate-semialdehyde dehydrogenase